MEREIINTQQSMHDEIPSSEPISASSKSAQLPYDELALAIYRDDYSAVYPSLYMPGKKNTPQWKKHNLNAQNLEAVLRGLASSTMPDWLDLACGQAWHFSMFSGRARMVGLDLSESQLTRARLRVPEAVFVQEDMARVSFPDASFDLVTNFWAGYCYLGSKDRIAALLHNIISWIRPGGSFYIEVLLPMSYESFNETKFSVRTGFSITHVRHHSDGCIEWQYEDIGGCHFMFSPPVKFFTDLLSPHFVSIETQHDNDIMVHLIASKKL